MIFLLIVFPLISVRVAVSHPSCVFNPMCTCSRSDANLGIVTCTNVPLSKIPVYVNRSKINSFHLENNDLKMIEPQFLSGTGLHVLKISRNPIYEIHIDLFKGLENSLRDLELSYLNLIEVPRKALHQLQRLQTLDLSGNDIRDVGQINWVNVRKTLETLILRENAIAHVPANAFERFMKLKTLDLAGNILIDMDPDAFFPDTVKLTYLNLADNQLRYIPYAQLQHLRSLKTLNLSYNFIAKINALSESTRTLINVKFSLNSLHLEYNEIRSISTEDFQKFTAINATYFDGNPITTIQVDTFQEVRVSELSFAGCGLIDFNAGMMKGLERSLLILDLSNNNLRRLDPNLFRYLLVLQELKILGNSIESFLVPDFNGNLLRLEVGGNDNTDKKALLEDIGRIKSLIRISISNVEVPYIIPDYFIGYGFGVEELSINNANLLTVHANAFVHIRGIKKLDLSNNQIRDIHENAFAEIGHSLTSLYLANAFSDFVKTFPRQPMNHLSSIRFLDVSNNRFEDLPVDSFYTMNDLEVIRMQDCQINTLRKDTFQSEIHWKLKEVTLPFNLLQVLKTGTFTDLPELQYINIEDNLLRTIEYKALNNLKKLKWVYLRGNKIENIDFEAFSNLPELEFLDLAFNNLKNFDFTCLDQMVGSLTFLSLNLTFNDIQDLNAYFSDLHVDIPNLSIKILDLSHNNVTNISFDYFTPLEYSLTHLYLSHNQLRNVSQDVFGSLYQLQWVDFSSNRIQFIDFDIFQDINKLQVIDLSHNEMEVLPPNVFYGLKNLRIVDLSDNRLGFVPERSFTEDSLERISFSKNRLTKIPFKSFTPEVSSVLREVDISNNAISTIHPADLIFQFKSLIFLNVSSNHIAGIEEPIFSHLNNLLYLDLSHNTHVQFVDDGRSFSSIQNNLVYLGLRNTSLINVPYLPFPKLISLYLSDNNISTITPEAVMNLTSVRMLDLSRNKLITLPLVILSMTSLRMLNISENNIQIISNNSLLSGFEELRELDISHLPLSTFETGALSRLTSLKTLYVTTYEDVDHFNIPRILERNNALKNLHIDVCHKDLSSEMHGTFPKKLRKMIISGKRLENIDSTILSGVNFPEFHLTLGDSQIQSVNEELFKNMLPVRNFSLDVRHNAFKWLPNPSTSTSLGYYNRTFLLALQLSGNQWNCKCDIGWVETWKRARRQILCRHLDLASSRYNYECIKTEDDLRNTLCSNKKPLMQVMKIELECGWNCSSYIFLKLEYTLILLFILFFNVILHIE